MKQERALSLAGCSAGHAKVGRSPSLLANVEAGRTVLDTLRDLACNSSSGISDVRAESPMGEDRHCCHLPFVAKCWWSTPGSSHPLKEKIKRVKDMVYTVYLRGNDTIIHAPVWWLGRLVCVKIRIHQAPPNTLQHFPEAFLFTHSLQSSYTRQKSREKEIKTLQPYHPEMIPANGLTYFYLHFLKSLVYLKKWDWVQISVI